MELNDMEKRMLYQTQGCERYAIRRELLMASRYAIDPDRKRAADSLMEKLRPCQKGSAWRLCMISGRTTACPKGEGQ